MTAKTEIKTFKLIGYPTLTFNVVRRFRTAKGKGVDSVHGVSTCGTRQTVQWVGAIEVIS